MRKKGLFNQLNVGEHIDSRVVCQDCIVDTDFWKNFKALESDLKCCSCLKSRPSYLYLSVVRLSLFIGLESVFRVDSEHDSSESFTLQEAIGLAGVSENAELCKELAEDLIKEYSARKRFYLPSQKYRWIVSPHEEETESREATMSQWRQIEHSLIHERRFFNQDAQYFFDDLLETIMGATARDGSEKTIVRLLAPSQKLYRARPAIAPSEVLLFQKSPDVELGAPPRNRAANNRMSPAGVRVFYASFEKETATAEIRPSIGDIVVVGTFEVQRELRLFDFTALDGELSYPPLSFLNSNRSNLSRARRLLRYLHEEIARPVKAYQTDYVVTQALAEFVRFHKGERFDGIVFRSVQNSEGTNVVLFEPPPPTNDLSPFIGMLRASKVEAASIRSVRYAAVPLCPQEVAPILTSTSKQ
jgi:hypothetical protein